MAGGKLTPRQKMINLMYLVFIAMLAMNMSKEVLSAFGLMNEKFESSNISSKETNAQMMLALDAKAAEAGGEFAEASKTAKKVQTATKTLNDFIETLKAEVLVGVEAENGKLPYEAMDKADNLNNSWFTGEGLTPRGKEVVAAIETYKSEMKAALSDKKYAAILKEVNAKFDLSEVSNKEGIKIAFLDYHFKGFPAIASLSKLSMWQSDVNKAESDVIAAALGKAAVQAASYSNYQAIVVLEKNAYFQGEQVKGKVVLGRYDENTVPTSFSGAGMKLENGQAVINTTAGGVGEQTLKGQFTFKEDGKEIPLAFTGNYVVVPRPNSATISADKMNVVYRGVSNPITVSFAGVSDNNVKVDATGGLSRGAKLGQYIIKPGAGTEVVINVNAKLPDGKTVSDKKVFRIKNIPTPQGAIAKTVGEIKGSKSRLENSEISVELPDFDFDLNLQVTQFTMKISGKPSVVVNGSRLDGRARAALATLGRGDIVTFTEIKSKIQGGGDVSIKTAAPVFYEIQ